MPERIEIVQGDITTLHVDAIVNAANSALAPGGGVCGAIHDAAGPELERECRAIGHCPTGEARITAGYHLPAHHVIHAVGPIWYGGNYDEAALLAGAYRSSLELASQHVLRTIAFPAISTGIYGYPLRDASHIAFATVRDYLATHDVPETVTFVCFGDATYRAYLEIATEGNV